jgi:glycerophosphoryl diester phosphodiesterase
MKQVRRILAILAIVGVALFTLVSPSQASTYRPLVSGHRGANAVPGVPENTMAAFKYAKKSGADVIEFDVYWTKATKGHPSYMVVIHDPTLERTTNGTGYVTSKTWAQLKKLNAGKGQHIPLFRDVIKYAKANGLRMNAEVKGNVTAAKPSQITSTITNAQAKRYIGVLADFNMTSRNVMSSASKSVIRTIQKNDSKKQIETALISYVDDSAEVAKSYGDAYMPTWKKVTPTQVRKLKSEGVSTYIWPIRTKSDFEKAYATRAAVLVADNPANVVEWLKDMR